MQTRHHVYGSIIVGLFVVAIAALETIVPAIADAVLGALR